MGLDKILCCCVLKHERPMILNEAHAGIVGGHMLENIECARCCKKDYGGPLSMLMLENIVATAISVRDLEIRRNKMKCC